MKRTILFCWVAVLLAGIVIQTQAQTAGTAKLETSIVSYSVDGPAHWTVAWVTTSTGTFIKSLRKQGTKYAWTSTQWQTHCTTWNNARGGVNGSTALDGYTSATATTYLGTNSPVILTWDCRDANNTLMPDGNYIFWVQYVEDTGVEGPYTTNGLAWTKGPAGATNTYPNKGANFTGMKVTWSPAATVAPTITSTTLPSSGTLGVPYNFTCTASGTAPVTFTASGLPTGLSISTAGVISGIPTAAGTFTGSIKAANGTLPDGTQAFSITVSIVPTTIGGIEISGNQTILSGSGPANGRYAVLTATNADAANWQSLITNYFAADGTFRVTNTMPAGVTRAFYRLRVP